MGLPLDGQGFTIKSEDASLFKVLLIQSTTCLLRYRVILCRYSFDALLTKLIVQKYNWIVCDFVASRD